MKTPRIRPVPVVVALTLAFGAAVTAFGVAQPPAADAGAPARLVREIVDISPSDARPDRPVSQSARIRRDDTLASLLGRLGAIDPDFAAFVAHDDTARQLLQFREGATVRADVDSIGRVHALQSTLDIIETPSGQPAAASRLSIVRDADGFRASVAAIALQRGTEHRSAVVRSSLFGATQEAGIPASVASQVADILGGDIDFYRDLRKGDRLEVLYESLSEPDSLEAPVPGRVLALTFRNGSRDHSAVWFEHEGGRRGYFSFAGKNLKKTFLRYPIEFARISSRFTDSRLHPVFGNRRAHRGVDFAAAQGTPVRSTGDGVVEFSGSQRGFGNVVILRHDARHSTLYAHLRGFAKGLRKGNRVEQGELIGYVGKTGWATGPHLHYEFRIAGAHTDPLAVALPSANPLNRQESVTFAAYAQPYRTRLTRPTAIALARFE
ncbi:MAG: peptidoglycan DD-metalloendopeptidase family protein [Burkholderiaceae bacterium]|nr:peptidoglycan DD-metalloendopeptidase family protein [Burkholderiaceae bacterium]